MVMRMTTSERAGFPPPDPGERMVGRTEVSVWLGAIKRAEHPRFPDDWVLNPGRPGEPELLPWKRATA